MLRICPRSSPSRASRSPRGIALVAGLACPICWLFVARRPWVKHPRRGLTCCNREGQQRHGGGYRSPAVQRRQADSAVDEGANAECGDSVADLIERDHPAGNRGRHGDQAVLAEADRQWKECGERRPATRTRLTTRLSALDTMSWVRRPQAVSVLVLVASCGRSSTMCGMSSPWSAQASRSGVAVVASMVAAWSRSK
jgi:hypothetical protein